MPHRRNITPWISASSTTWGRYRCHAQRRNWFQTVSSQNQGGAMPISCRSTRQTTDLQSRSMRWNICVTNSPWAWTIASFSPSICQLDSALAAAHEQLSPIHQDRLQTDVGRQQYDWWKPTTSPPTTIMIWAAWNSLDYGSWRGANIEVITHDSSSDR